MNFIKKLALLSLLTMPAWWLLGCGSTTDTAKIPVTIERFDKALLATKNKAELTELLTKNPDYFRLFYRAHPEDTALVNHIDLIVRHPEARGLHQQVEQQFGNLAKLEAEFGEAFGKIKAQFPDFVPPKIVATFSGLENDIYVSDSVVYIALESFLGPKANYRPQQPDYILYRYEQPFIVPTVVRFISDKYNNVPTQDGTLLDDMIYFGKSFAFTKAMLPEGSDTLIIAYPDSVMRKTWAAQDLVWAHFLDKGVLYDKSPHIRQKYIGERPKVSEIGPACPGRVGQWVGWRIVERYQAENPSVTLPELMKNANSQEIFSRSKYRGQLEE